MTKRFVHLESLLALQQVPQTTHVSAGSVFELAPGRLVISLRPHVSTLAHLRTYAGLCISAALLVAAVLIGMREMTVRNDPPWCVAGALGLFALLRIAADLLQVLWLQTGFERITIEPGRATVERRVNCLHATSSASIERPHAISVTSDGPSAFLFGRFMQLVPSRRAPGSARVEGEARALEFGGWQPPHVALELVRALQRAHDAAVRSTSESGQPLRGA